MSDTHDSRLNNLLEAARAAEIKLRDGGVFPINGETWRALRDALLPYKGIASFASSEAAPTWIPGDLLEHEYRKREGLLPEDAPLEGKWVKDDPRRAFVSGAKWWEWTVSGATMWPEDVDKAERAAETRYPMNKGESK